MHPLSIHPSITRSSLQPSSPSSRHPPPSPVHPPSLRHASSHPSEVVHPLLHPSINSPIHSPSTNPSIHHPLDTPSICPLIRPPSLLVHTHSVQSCCQLSVYLILIHALLHPFGPPTPVLLSTHLSTHPSIHLLGDCWKDVPSFIHPFAYSSLHPSSH